MALQSEKHEEKLHKRAQPYTEKKIDMEKRQELLIEELIVDVTCLL